MPPSSLGVRISSLSFRRSGVVLLDAVEGGFLPYPWKLLPRDLPHHVGECRPARANTQPDQPLLNAIYARDLARGREPALDDLRPKSPSGRLLFLGC